MSVKETSLGTVRSAVTDRHRATESSEAMLSHLIRHPDTLEVVTYYRWKVSTMTE